MAGLVQEASGSTTGSTLTLTFPAAVTAGSAVVVALGGYYGGAVSGFTVDGSSVPFTKVATSGGHNAEIWAAYGVAGTPATVTITATAAGILGWAYEVAGVVRPDTTAGTFGSGTSWSSGPTAATIPGQHVVIGLGISLGAGRLTVPLSGWANEKEYVGVRTGTTRRVSGVSAYQQPSASGQYAYAGTAAADAGWAAVTAAFLALPPPAQLLAGWGGYVFSEHGSYTGISATFTLPELSGGDYNSVWVGLGNVYQVGVYQTYDTSFPGNAWSRPWTWWLPGAGENWNASAFPTATGDSLTLTVQLTGTDWLMTIANNSQGWTYTEDKSVLAVNLGSVPGSGAGSPFWPYPLTTAEVIIEKEADELAGYGSVAFTAVTTTPAATAAPEPVLTANTAIDQYPGAFDLADGSFTLYWNGFS